MFETKLLKLNVESCLILKVVKVAEEERYVNRQEFKVPLQCF